MTLSAILDTELNRIGVSNADVSRATYTSPSTVHNYRHGKRGVPGEFIKSVGRLFGSVRLIITHTFECGCGLFKTKYLAGVDDHPVTVRDICKQELREALDALDKDPVENKLRREDWTEDEWDRHKKATLHLADLHAALEKRLESDQKYYGQDPEEIEQETNRKLDTRGYTKERSTKT